MIECLGEPPLTSCGQLVPKAPPGKSPCDSWPLASESCHALSWLAKQTTGLCNQTLTSPFSFVFLGLRSSEKASFLENQQSPEPERSVQPPCCFSCFQGSLGGCLATGRAVGSQGQVMEWTSRPKLLRHCSHLQIALEHARLSAESLFMGES